MSVRCLPPRRHRGFSTSLEALITVPIVLFIVFFPPVIGSTIDHRLILNEVLQSAKQDASREGCVDHAVISDMQANLQGAGLDPTLATIQSNATPTSPINLPSTTPIQITISYPDSADAIALNGLLTLLGLPGKVITQNGGVYDVVSGETLSTHAPY